MMKSRPVVYCDRECVNKVLDENGYGFCGKESISISLDGFCEDHEEPVEEK